VCVRVCVCVCVCVRARARVPPPSPYARMELSKNTSSLFRIPSTQEELINFKVEEVLLTFTISII